MSQFTGDGDRQLRSFAHRLIAMGQPMSKTTKTDFDPAPPSDAAAAKNTDNKTAAASVGETDVLHFLSRTLQAHFLDAEPHEILAKLRNLKNALEQQEATLSRWPESPSKERMCAALAKARNLITQIADEYGAAAGGDAGINRRIPAISSARRSAAYRD
jgi:hypothetical protein